jgi:serine/threonine-protein kinase
MSPEQARGDRDLDGRVDLYACGVILYEALTGRRPFNASSYERLLLQILSSSPRPASELRPALPKRFDGVIEKAMARNRDDRFENASEFQQELQSWRSAADRSESVPVADSAPPLASLSRVKSAALSYGPEAPISTVEIPISFGTDTLSSAESAAFDKVDADAAAEATDVMDCPTSDAAESTAPSSRRKADVEEDPTQLMPRPAPGAPGKSR